MNTTDNTPSTIQTAPAASSGIVTYCVMGAVVLLVAVAGFKLSFTAIGDRSAGHTALVWKTDQFAELNFLDSSTAVCYRKGMRYGMERESCEAGLSFALQDSKARLAALPFSEWLANR